MQLKALQDTRLKKSLQASALDKMVSSGQEYSIDKVLSRQQNHALVQLSFGQGSWWLYLPHWSNLETTNVQLFTFAQFQACFPDAAKSDLDIFYPLLNTSCKAASIETPRRLAAFFAQIGHESGSFKYKEEIASGAAYEGRRDLGNTQSGDGRRFKGRGIIQITGRANYRYYGKLLGVDLESNPSLAKEPPIASQVACAFWQARNLNKYADAMDLKKITRLINGGLNGLDDRTKRYNRAKQVFQI